MLNTMINALRQLKITALSLFWKQLRLVQIWMGGKSCRVPLKKIGDAMHHVFFGYYDICPFNKDGSILLANRLKKKDFSKSSTATMEVGFYEINNDPVKFYKVADTTTWCSQQGCRLQWYPAANEKQILYNCIIGNNHGCVIQDIESGEVIRSIPRSVYALSPNGNWGLNLNFSRLHRLREGYGYSNFQDTTRDELAPDNDGIWLIDMSSGKDKLLLSVKEMTSFESMETMKGAEHYFNHLLFSPSGKRFLFFHIWVKNQKRYTRLITCNLEGQERCALINEGHVSHYYWLDEKRIIAVATHSDKGFGYYVYNDQTMERYKIENRDLLYDGHPSIASTGIVVTDTYPNKWGEQALMLFSPEINKIETIGLFHSPPHLKGTLRCDLHPRWDSEGKNICFDSAHQGNRAIYLAEVTGFFD
jgi:hypothetical protein